MQNSVKHALRNETKNNKNCGIKYLNEDKIPFPSFSELNNFAYFHQFIVQISRQRILKIFLILILCKHRNS